MRRRKPHLAPRTAAQTLGELARLAQLVVDLEMRLIDARARWAADRDALRRERARNQDLASRVPVDVARARRALARHRQPGDSR